MKAESINRICYDGLIIMDDSQGDKTILWSLVSWHTFTLLLYLKALCYIERFLSGNRGLLDIYINFPSKNNFKWQLTFLERKYAIRRPKTYVKLEQWRKPVTPANQEAEVGELQVQAQLRQLCRTLSENRKIKQLRRINSPSVQPPVWSEAFVGGHLSEDRNPEK